MCFNSKNGMDLSSADFSYFYIFFPSLCLSFSLSNNWNGVSVRCALGPISAFSQLKRCLFFSFFHRRSILASQIYFWISHISHFSLSWAAGACIARCIQILTSPLILCAIFNAILSLSTHTQIHTRQFYSHSFPSIWISKLNCCAFAHAN